MNAKSLMRQFLWENRLAYGISILAIILSNFINVQFPNILGRFTNALQAHRLNSKDVMVYAVLLLVVGVVYVQFYAIGQYRNGRLGRQFEYLLRRRLFAHWELLSTEYFRHRSIGDLLNHAMNDIRQVREALSGGLNILTNAIFLLLATLIMTFTTISVKLTLFSMIPLVFIPVFIVWFGPQIRDSSRKVQEALSDMSELTEESLSSIRLIKATANERVETERFRDKVDHIVSQQLTLFRRSATFQAFIPTMSSISFAIALLYGGYLALSGQIKLGAFVAFTLYVGQLVQPLQQIGFVINNFQRASASLIRLQVLLEEKPSITDAPHPVELSSVRGEIQVHLPAFQYSDGQAPVLRNIEFRVLPGQTLGIVGRTGSGKTTLANLLPRIFDPPANTIFLDGHDIREIRLETLRKAIAYVPQDGFLFSTSVGENISFGDANATRAQVEQAAKAARVYDDIAAFPDGFDTVIGERGVTLSGGQRQRTAIARAFLKSAPILIMDDSLSAVDMNTEKQIIAALERVRQSRTTLIIAHRLSAVRHADHIIVLEDGVIAEEGTHEELIAKGGLYAKTYHIQQEGEVTRV
ncbi:ABC transporter ATP-binding protein [Alicyclobacillus fastidiosus]|uniref:ABC transporter ATP-binding protein n=1 Tax=Alicyclobacillus fastidiosus TaxID=392011 RepID=A0ABV5A999_9BACL|nr:ABC transporter ATP-binding protein [Alicyclobacillus fastidiosus]WEH10788.1 ABC transporter ATP-binding protein [Alicyclobacillus fastidiosus]